MQYIIDLFSKYSFIDILTVVIMLGLSIKGIISFFQQIKHYTKKIVYKSDESDKIKENLKQQEVEIKDLKSSIQQINKLIRLLIESDKDDIKAFITRQHHYFVYQKGWIDDYSLDCIEQRYNHYEDQGGNSFIASLMKELRALPKQPPTQNN